MIKMCVHTVRFICGLRTRVYVLAYVACMCGHSLRTGMCGYAHAHVQVECLGVYVAVCVSGWLTFYSPAVLFFVIIMKK